MKAPLVSIIIPTYNRSHLIAETLDSVLAQTYTNWECIVVDDGSIDRTDTLLAEYCKKDTRFQYHHRPLDRPKGANACRNYGFELSKGEYINWFDSDDLMSKDFIHTKVDCLINSNYDFVISKTGFFKDKIKNIEYVKYNLIDKKPTIFNFLIKSQIWFTPDGMFLKLTLKNIHWDESLYSGQEFNFICKYLSKKFNGFFIDNVLTYARVHKVSIHSYQNSSEINFNLNKFKAYFLTFLEINCYDDTTENKLLVKNKLLDLSISFSFNIAKNKKKIPFFIKLIKTILVEKGFVNFFYYNLSIILAYLIGKGYLFMNKSRIIKQV